MNTAVGMQDRLGAVFGPAVIGSIVYGILQAADEGLAMTVSMYAAGSATEELARQTFARRQNALGIVMTTAATLASAFAGAAISHATNHSVPVQAITQGLVTAVGGVLGVMYRDVECDF